MNFIELEIRRNLVRHFWDFFDQEGIGKIKFECEDGNLNTDWTDDAGRKLNGVYTLLDIDIPNEDIRKNRREGDFRHTYDFKDGIATENIGGGQIPYIAGTSFEVLAKPAKIRTAFSINRATAMAAIKRDIHNNAGKVYLYMGRTTSNDSLPKRTRGEDAGIRAVTTVGVIYVIPVNSVDRYADIWGDKENVLFALPTTAEKIGTSVVNFVRTIDRKIWKGRILLDVEYEYRDDFSFAANLKENSFILSFKDIFLEVEPKHE